jgi:hypothetical protein
MDDKQFFRYYIPALEIAMNFEENIPFNVKGPDWFVDDNKLRRELDLFEQNNFDRYEQFFQMVALYFDAWDHNFNEIDGVSLSDHKKKLEAEIEIYKKKFSL